MSDADRSWYVEQLFEMFKVNNGAAAAPAGMVQPARLPPRRLALRPTPNSVIAAATTWLD